MSLNPCVKAILCSLSGGVLNALQTIIKSQEAVLQAQVLTWEAQLLQYDIIAIPIEAAGQIATAAIAKIRNSALLIPLNLIAGCADLDSFNVGLQRSLDFATASLDRIVLDLTRILSFKTELAFGIQELNGVIAQFNDVLAVIATCGPLTGV